MSSFSLMASFLWEKDFVLMGEDFRTQPLVHSQCLRQLQNKRAY